ncbi:MAG: DUF1801 domain-containing protein [Thermoplasmatota archaeon]
MKPEGHERKEGQRTGRMAGPNGGIDAIIHGFPDGRGAMLSKLREIIHAADPDVAEVVKWRKPSSPLGAAVFEHEGIVCILIPLKGRVRMSFVEGAVLPDPKKLFNAQLNGKSRAIDFPAGVKIDAVSLKALIRAAVERRRRGARQHANAVAPVPKRKPGR